MSIFLSNWDFSSINLSLLFSIDFAIPHFRQLHITEVDKAHNTVVGKLYPEGNYKVEAGKLLSWSTFEGPDFRYLLSTGLSGNVVSILLFVLWAGLFYVLYRARMAYNKKMEEAGE